MTAMTVGQLLEVLKSVPPETEVITQQFGDFYTQPQYYAVKKVIVKHSETGESYQIIIVDEREII